MMIRQRRFVLHQAFRALCEPVFSKPKGVIQRSSASQLDEAKWHTSDGKTAQTLFGDTSENRYSAQWMFAEGGGGGQQQQAGASGPVQLQCRSARDGHVRARGVVHSIGQRGGQGASLGAPIGFVATRVAGDAAGSVPTRF